MIVDDITCLEERLDDAEYLISLRPSWLPLRQGDHMILECYQPHRCAHQFGLDQMIPVTDFPLERLSLGLECLAACWTAILRLDTRSRFCIPTTSRIVRFSGTYHYWYQALISVYQTHHPHEVQARTCLSRRDSDRKKERLRKERAEGKKRDHGSSSSQSVLWSQDFQGLDGTISYAGPTEPPSLHPGVIVFLN